MRKFFYTTIFFITSIILVGCSKNSNTSIVEYDVEEFGEIYLETQELFEAESEYFTDEEKFGELGYALYKKCSKKTGLPFNKQIKLRGKKSPTDFTFFYIESTDKKYQIPCSFSYDNDLSLLVNDGDIIVVTGTFSGSVDSFGCLTDISIVSKIDTAFNNNMAQVLSQSSYDSEHSSDAYTIRGEVHSIQTLNEFEEYMAVSMDNNGYEHQDYYYDKVITITGDMCFISFAYDSKWFPDIKVGDKIATQGCFLTTRSFEVDEVTTINWGFIGNAYSIYVYE